MPIRAFEAVDDTATPVLTTAKGGPGLPLAATGERDRGRSGPAVRDARRGGGAAVVAADSPAGVAAKHSGSHRFACCSRACGSHPRALWQPPPPRCLMATVGSSAASVSRRMPTVRRVPTPDAAGDAPRSAAELLLAHGQGHRSPATETSRVTDGAAGACYETAFRLACAENLYYAEGYACPLAVGVPLMHAWCLDADGAVVDPTWPDASQTAYLGVVLDMAIVAEVVAAQGVLVVLSNLHCDGFALPALLRPALTSPPVVLTADVDAVRRTYSAAS